MQESLLSAHFSSLHVVQWLHAYFWNMAGVVSVGVTMLCNAMQDRAHPAVKHALKVRQALVFSQFTAFFQLYAAAPNLGRYLMDMCFSRIRFVALETLIDAFKNTKVKVTYVASVLGFLIKPEGESFSESAGESAAVSTTQRRSRPNTPTVRMSNLHLRFDEEADGDSAGELVLPGCAKTTVVGKHAAEVSSVFRTSAACSQSIAHSCCGIRK